MSKDIENWTLEDFKKEYNNVSESWYTLNAKLNKAKDDYNKLFLNFIKLKIEKDIPLSKEEKKFLLNVI